jgi:hypothetical protein
MRSNPGILSMARLDVKTTVRSSSLIAHLYFPNIVVVSSTEYNNIIKEEYNKKLSELGDEGSDSAVRKSHFKVQLDWYESKMQDFIYLKKKNGNFDSVVANIVDDFDRLVSYFISFGLTYSDCYATGSDSLGTIQRSLLWFYH